MAEPVPLEAEHQRRSGTARVAPCSACSGQARVAGLGGGPRNAVTYRDVPAATAGEHRLQIDHTAAGPASLSVSVNGATPITVPVTGDNPGVPQSTALPVPLRAGANTIKLHNDTAAAPDLDRISLGGT